MKQEIDFHKMSDSEIENCFEKSLQALNKFLSHHSLNEDSKAGLSYELGYGMALYGNWHNFNKGYALVAARKWLSQLHKKLPEDKIVTFGG